MERIAKFDWTNNIINHKFLKVLSILSRIMCHIFVMVREYMLRTTCSTFWNHATSFHYNGKH